jgi:hypothetical protein
MSTYWDVYCKDCQTEAGIDNLNHGKDTVREIISVKHDVAAAARISHLLSDGFKLQGHSYLPAAWFVEHASHHLVPRSEHGDVLDDRCEACGASEQLRVGGYGHSIKTDSILCEQCRGTLQARSKGLLLKTAHLSVWHRTRDWVIAATEEQCWELYAEETGDEDRDPDSGWTRLEDSAPMDIYLDSDGDITNYDGSMVQLPCWVWVAKFGKARYLCREM